jgi:hypothetical protein
MAIVKSKWVRRFAQTARPQTANNTHVQQFTFDLGTEGALAAGDILELGILPAYARLIDAQLITEGVFTGQTADIGIMTGDVGEDFNADGTTARTSSNELFTAADLTVRLQSLTKPDAILLAAVDYDRSIGVKVSAAVAAAAGKRVHLILHFYQ